MRAHPYLKFFAAAALALLAAGAASAAQTVTTYVAADKFTDVPFGAIERERLLKDLSAHFAHLGKQLPQGQELKLEVTDVDLAGRIDWSRRSGQDLRLVTGGADWPRLELRYTLSEGGKVLDSGEAKLSSMNYQQQMNFYSSGEPLRYEKQMLDEWFGKTFKVKVKRG